MHDDLWTRIVDTYETASRSGAAFKTQTQVEVLTDPESNLSFVLRISESLQQKPKSEPLPTHNPPPPKRNPFLPYDEALWVSHLSESHTMLLNKFNLLDRHVLIVTREFESQEDPLNSRDISATKDVLQSMPQGGVAFFNCGPLSGASQPHKHTQIVPLPLSDSLSLPLDELYKTSVQNQASLLKDLPFLAFGVGLDGTEGIQRLLRDYQDLLEKAKRRLGDDFGSYNLIWTKNWMILIPRSQAGSGPCNLNSLGFAGTIFVKSKEESEYVKNIGPMKILKHVTFPNST